MPATESTPAKRTHIVLVPGFAGFDALGQLHYYADVTPLFRGWASAPGRRAVLHYFDNLPTAGVTTRARRLRDWLAKRLARGELQRGDEVALVGHSTGGLDIRQLVCDLADDPQRVIAVDGAAGAAYTVRAQDLLELVKRIVFLSVPQRGTNIADWVRSHPVARRAVVASLVGVLRATDLPVAERLADPAAARTAAFTACATRSDFFLAVEDALLEMDEHATADPVRVAAALEARGEVELWLRYAWADFAAIDDLAASPDVPGPSPARFDELRRTAELAVWKALGIVTRSYATIGRRPFAFPPRARLSPWNPMLPWTWPDAVAGAARDTDLAYRLCYRACAGGPFVLPGDDQSASATRFDTGDRQDVELWDNDGIVNTASMLWPEGPGTRLVPADHGDIIGHFRLVNAVQPSARRHHTYDLLGSRSGFGEKDFQAVWNDVFDFCAASPITAAPLARGSPAVVVVETD